MSIVHVAVDYDSLSCQALSFTNFSLSSMYLPDHPQSHNRHETGPMLTFLVSLRIVRRLEVVPSNAVIASETVNIRHRVHPSPKYTGPQNISSRHEGPPSHTHRRALSSLLANLMFVADCMRLRRRLESRNDDEDENTHYPRPSRPENALLISSS